MFENGYKLWLSGNRNVRWFIFFCLLLCSAYYVLEYFNGRSHMADFRVYYDATRASLSGAPVYGVSFGVSSGFYKYSPLALFFFMPLALLPYTVASILFYGFIALATVWWLSYLYHWLIGDKLIGRYKPVLVLSLTALFMADHIERELHLGNVNLFLLIMAFFVYKSIIRGKQMFAGVLFTLLILVKPHFLILLPYFIWKRKWLLAGSALLATGVGLLLPGIFFGWEQNIMLHRQWLGAIRDHNVDLSESPNTVYGLVNAVVHLDKGAFLIPILLAVVALSLVFLMIKNTKTLQTYEVNYLEYFILIALIPNLAHTDTEHFMWSWPLIMYTLASIVSAYGELRKYALLMLIAFVPYCINSPDLVGRSAQQFFDGGMMGLANLVIILCSVGVWFSAGNRTPLNNLQNR